jgi:hypothetical protein
MFTVVVHQGELIGGEPIAVEEKPALAKNDAG